MVEFNSMIQSIVYDILNTTGKFGINVKIMPNSHDYVKNNVTNIL